MNDSLINQDNYIKYINELDLKKKTKLLVNKLVNEENDSERVNIWNEILEIEKSDKLEKLANPYFIGFGNAKSDILFFGQEKAFDVESSSELLLHESINNNYQWTKITENEHVPLIFNPQFPRKYHSFKMRTGHTWNLYSKIIASFYNLNSKEIFEETIERENSFFNLCFVSEINTIPRRKNKGDKISSIRIKFLQNDFYKNFKFVIIGASTSLGENADEIIKTIFNAELIKKKLSLGKYGKNNLKDRNISLYKSNKQVIILCNQLSGSAGWKNTHLIELSKILKKHVENN
ncbi:hypothetical protein H7F37_03045 [Winogradskyella sp. PAMC22761]|nr:hypothetical protein H7F37_03045 [Winogradskyella sp. PAMC22761]